MGSNPTAKWSCLTEWPQPWANKIKPAVRKLTRRKEKSAFNTTQSNRTWWEIPNGKLEERNINWGHISSSYSLVLFDVTKRKLTSPDIDVQFEYHKNKVKLTPST